MWLFTVERISAGNSAELSNSSNRRPGVRHSTFESLRLGLSSQSIASGFLRFWDSLNFKKDREFVGITVLFLDEKIFSLACLTSGADETQHPRQTKLMQLWLSYFMSISENLAINSLLLTLLEEMTFSVVGYNEYEKKRRLRNLNEKRMEETERSDGFNKDDTEEFNEAWRQGGVITGVVQLFCVSL
ncbi:hypothetical protein F2Q70_00016228 [Brassica cretica]|uniref:Uncharacterized protein n=1 Tax=Brassica cretica TaxID=69181 RepID=A0A8S9HTY9_BRACR|nr:hypothetical protein F2Q70_00016228 [Brassica cretica]